MSHIKLQLKLLLRKVLDSVTFLKKPPQDHRTQRLIECIKILSSLNYDRTNIKTYLQEIAQNVSQLLETDWSVITLCQNDAEKILASSVEIGEAMEQIYLLHGTLTGSVVASGNPLIVKDAKTCEEYGECPEGYRAYLGVPLRISTGEVIGTICSFQRQPRQFAQEEIHLAELFAERAATAIDNYQLYHKQQQANEQLSITNAELAQAIGLKDEFLAHMSHEFRTPLTAIIGLAEVLEDEVYGSLTPKQKKSLKTIEYSGRHLLELINDLLDLSKIESGKMELQTSAVSLQSLGENSLIFVREEANKKHIELSNEISSHIRDIEVDEKRIRQVLINLLSNAVKFTPSGGKVCLRAWEDTTNQVTHVSVSDTGIGIDKNDLPKLFKPFVQLDSSLSRRYTGTGLGLALVHRLVELHGGSVAVESDVGQGSKFTIILPRESYLTKIKHSSDNSNLIKLFTHNLSSSPTVLLAEDNEVVLGELKEFLEANKFRVLVARNGLQVLAMAQQHLPNIIVMDMQMPELSGLEAVHQIKAKINQVNIPIIAVTSLVIPEEKEQCLRAGCNEYFSKPINPQYLIQILVKYC